MNALEKTMDIYAEKLLKNHNLAKEEQQRNLLTKEDYLEILKPALKVIEKNKDTSIDEIREELYKCSGVEEIVENSVYKKQMVPGAVITYGTKNYQEMLTLGTKSEDFSMLNVTNGSTLYDLASVTKLFTSISVQILARKNMLDLSKKVSYYLPDFPGLKDITIYELLTFNAPVKTDGRIDKANDLEEAENILKTITFDDANNGQRPYTDMGAMVLKYIVEKVSKMEFYNFINKHILEVSNMYDTYVSIPEKMLYRVAPTGNNGFYYKDDNYRINTDVKLGECYDEKARIMGQKAGNLSGHAGLFSTGYDMIEFSHALLTQTILTEEELHHMADNETGKKGKQIQYLGKLCYSKNPVQEDSEIYHPLGGRAIASAGWTGTQITIDPDNEIFYSLLSNRSHNRMTFIDKDKKDLIKTDDNGKKTIILPNGKEMIDASRYAWDRDAALVHPVIKLSIWYKFLEEIYEGELVNSSKTYFKKRRI